MDWKYFKFDRYSLIAGACCYPVIVAGAPSDSVNALLTQIDSLLQLIKLPSSSKPNYEYADSSIVIGWCQKHAPKLLTYLRVEPNKLAEVLRTTPVYNDFAEHCQPHIAEMCDSPQYLEFELPRLFALANTVFPSETGTCALAASLLGSCWQLFPTAVLVAALPVAATPDHSPPAQRLTRSMQAAGQPLLAAYS